MDNSYILIKSILAYVSNSMYVESLPYFGLQHCVNTMYFMDVERNLVSKYNPRGHLFGFGNIFVTTESSDKGIHSRRTFNNLGPFVLIRDLEVPPLGHRCQELFHVPLNKFYGSIRNKGRRYERSTSLTITSPQLSDQRSDSGQILGEKHRVQHDIAETGFDVVGLRRSLLSSPNGHHSRLGS